MLSKSKAGAKKGSVAAGGDIKDSTINIGVTAEYLLETLKESQRIEGRFQLLLEQQEGKIAELSEALEVTEKAVLGFLKILGEQEIAREQIDSTLRQIAERYIELTKGLHFLSKSNEEPDIAKHREQAAAAVEEGDYDRAAGLLEEAAEIHRRTIEDHQDALDRRKLAAAATLSQQGELERIRLNYRKSAEHFAEAARLVAANESNAQVGYLLKQASALHDQGYQFGDNPALIVAIDLYQTILSNCERATSPNEWADTQNGIGATLSLIGAQESGTARLEEAIKAFRLALKERKRELHPLEWAATQHDLGMALSNIGSRESGNEHLIQAVMAYSLALEERTRERTPIEWATTHHHLGNALRFLGERESGLVHVEEAIIAFHSALEEITRERRPTEWATVQMNLGNALRVFGERSTGTGRLEQAVTAYRLALSERKREREPLYWATCQDRLGTALCALGRRQRGTACLEEAVVVLRLALEERTRERSPLHWAWTQDHLGSAYCSIGEKTRDEAILVQAIEAFQDCLGVYEAGQETHYVERAKKNLASAKVLLSHIKGARGLHCAPAARGP